MSRSDLQLVFLQTIDFCQQALQLTSVSTGLVVLAVTGGGDGLECGFIQSGEHSVASRIGLEADRLAVLVGELCIGTEVEL